MPRQDTTRQRSWTDEEIAILREAYATARAAEDLNIRALAARLGRTYASVALKASRLGFTDQGRPMVLVKKVRRPMFDNDTDRRAAVGERVKRLWAERGHPRGALGIKHTPEALAVISAKSKAAWSRPECANRTESATQRRSDTTMKMMLTRPADQQYTRTHGGRREDLGGVYFRSSWEANYARWLNLLVKNGNIRGWEYEPETFIFHTISRGCRTYTPDFRIELASGGHEWHEVKGWMDPKSKTRLDRMLRHYPGERVIVIGADWFKDANRKGIGQMLPGWESAATAKGRGR